MSLPVRKAAVVAVGALSLSLSLMLGACSREETPTVEPTAEVTAAEPPPVEEPFAVEAIAGEESTQDNPATASTLPPTAAADAATSGTDSAPIVPADAPDNSAIKATSFRGYGNEPFWNIDIDAGMANYKTLENQTGTMLQVKRSGEGNKVVYSGNKDGKQFAFTFVKRKCLDSMSGRPYEYWVNAKIDGRDVNGCADSK